MSTLLLPPTTYPPLAISFYPHYYYHNYNYNHLLLPPATYPRIVISFYHLPPDYDLYQLQYHYLYQLQHRHLVTLRQFP